MSLDETLKITGDPISEILSEIRSLTTRVAAIETSISRIDWESLRRDFSKHHRDIADLIGDLDRKFDVVSRELLQVKAEQIRLNKRLNEMESEMHWFRADN